MVNPYRIILAFFCLIPLQSYAQTAPVGAVDLAGWVKGADGTYTKAFGGTAKVTLSSPPSGVSTTSTAVVSTSKGLHNFEITKTAIVDTARVGASVVGLLKKVGPVGVAIGTASLVCELSNICDNAGQWFQNSPYDPAYYPDQTTSVQSYCTGGLCSGTYDTRAGSAAQSCKEAAEIKKLWGDDRSGVATSETNCRVTVTSTGNFLLNSSITLVAGCPPLYAQSGAVCIFTQSNDSSPATDADFEAAKQKLNDTRFIPEILEKLWDLPTSGVPTLTPNQKKGLGLESVPTKDASGNITGREDTMTEIEAVDGASAESPGRVIIKETKTTIKYDNNNNQISTTTTTNYTNQTSLETQPTNYEIKFDTVEPFELPTYNVPNTYSSTSWGSGTCPPDITVATSIMTFAIPSQPVCDTAEMLNPFVLLISTILGIYIISGVRGGTYTS